MVVPPSPSTSGLTETQLMQKGQSASTAAMGTGELPVRAGARGRSHSRTVADDRIRHSRTWRDPHGRERASSDAQARADQALTEVGLDDKRGQWPAVLSGGQKQRVALARALVSHPRVLAFDEPLGALDALTRISMQRLLERVWHDQAFTAILVTHDVSEAVALADRVLVIEDGRIAHDVDVDIPRPRRRGSADLAALEGSILRNLLQSGEETSDL
jgi:sulfonate transport system ATP-binding protein